MNVIKENTLFPYVRDLIVDDVNSGIGIIFDNVKFYAFCCRTENGVFCDGDIGHGIVFNIIKEDTFFISNRNRVAGHSNGSVSTVFNIANLNPCFTTVNLIVFNSNCCDRITLKLIGTPLTHQRCLRRHQGTYGPSIAAGKGLFPGCKTPIKGLYRVGDSTLPGIGVPAVAASGILCANSLVSPREAAALLDLQAP